MSAGKGDAPRNCFTKQYRDNFDRINWGNKTLGWLRREVKEEEKKQPNITQQKSNGSTE